MIYRSTFIFVSSDLSSAFGLSLLIIASFLSIVVVKNSRAFRPGLQKVSKRTKVAQGVPVLLVVVDCQSEEPGELYIAHMLCSLL